MEKNKKINKIKLFKTLIRILKTFLKKLFNSFIKVVDIENY